MPAGEQWLACMAAPGLQAVTAGSELDAQGAIRALADRLRAVGGAADPAAPSSMTWLHREPTEMKIVRGADFG